MSIQRERYDGPVTFVCDDCWDTDETRCSDFNSALAKLKSHDWQVRKRDGEWVHICPDCKD